MTGQAREEEEEKEAEQEEEACKRWNAVAAVATALSTLQPHIAMMDTYIRIAICIDRICNPVLSSHH